MRSIFNILDELAQDEDGANLAEYALLLAVLTAGIAAALPLLQNTIQAGIIGIADAYDAMTSDRPYRPALTIEDAANEIRRCAGEQFDPAVADAFISIAAEKWREIRERVHRQVTDLEEQVKRVLG